MNRLFTTLLFALLLLTKATATPPVTEPTRANDTNRSTHIESANLELVNGEKETVFVFSGNVRVTGTNLTVNCDRLEVRTKSDGEGDQAFGQIGAIASITADGNVEIRQAGRIANAEKAELFPEEGRIILSGKPTVRDRQGEVSGERIVLLRDQRRALVEGGEGRARVRLGQLPDLGFQDRENGAPTSPKKPKPEAEESPTP